MSQQLRLLIYAGVAARQAGNPGTALLLLNRYLDIHEAQEDGSHGSQGGYNDFGLFTGIPRSSALPKAHYVPKAEREQVRAGALHPGQLLQGQLCEARDAPVHAAGAE